MPRIAPTAALQLVLLLSALPAQYLISRWSGSTHLQRQRATASLIQMWTEWRSSYLDAAAWAEWTEQQISTVKAFIGFGDDETPQESLAIESMLYDNDQGFFGASKAVRSPRPPFVFLRVGEVVMERRGHMVGVVVSWDPELRAPTEWIDKVYSNAEGPRAEKTPHYKVLFSGPGSSSLLIAYLPQTELQRITGMRPDIPMLDNYFTHFDGTRFVMQPWLRKIFPEDDKDDDDNV